MNGRYHDVENAEYASIHPEILVDEVNRWETLGRLLFSTEQRPLRVLDIGTGTGFVPAQIGKFLREADVVVCADISAGILQVCRRTLERLGYPCRFEYLKLDGRRIESDSESFDYVTMNLVLHHIPEFLPFLAEVNRVTKVDGSVVICHEPNPRFFSHPILWSNYRLISLIFPKRLALSLVTRLGLRGLVRKLYVSRESQGRERIASKVSGVLMEEGLIKEPLTATRLGEIVDIHAPGPGRDFKTHRGINLLELVATCMPNFGVSHCRSNSYHGELTNANRMTE